MERKKLNRQVAEEQWSRFADEYTLETGADLGDDDRSTTLKGLQNALIRYIMAGFVDIIEDVTEGIIIKQYLSREIEGLDDGFIKYLAPNPGHIAAAGIGKEMDTTNNMRYFRLACALSGHPEVVLGRLKGGDRSRMETIASLFLLA